MKYIGLRIYMALNNRPDYDRYWSRSNPLHGDKIVYETMSRNRFEEIKSNFRIYTENDINKNKENLCTLAETGINFINHKFKTLFSPGKEICIDEGICPWKGKL